MMLRSFCKAGRIAAVLALATGLAAAALPAQAAPPQQIIVKFNDKMAAAERIASPEMDLQRVAAEFGLQAEFQRRIVTGGDVFRLSGDRLDSRQLDRLLARIAESPAVDYAEEDRILKAFFTPNDTRYTEQWHYYESTGGLNAPGAWDTTSGSGQRVAVLDTGYRPHADLAANIVGGYDFIGDTFVANDGNGRDSDAQDPGDWYTSGECGAGTGSSNSSWHGTHVAGTIAAVTNNSSGVAGVAYSAKVVPLRVLGKCGGYTSDIADAIVWGAGGTVSGVPANSYPAKVISLSLGGSGSCDSTTQTAINSARSLGASVIVAAGNSNANAGNYSPASCSGVVTIAATGRTGGKAYYSNTGSVVDVAAPGGDTSSGSANGVLSTLNSGTTTPSTDSYAFYQGTSMATPHVSGVAALMLAVNPALTPDQVESILKSTARPFPATCSSCGTGIVSASAAVAAAPSGGGGGGGGGGTTTLTNGVPVTGISGATGSSLQYSIAVPSGATNLVISTSGGSGDADLYVKFGSAPTTSSYDCRPYKSGNAESCTFATPSTGTYYVMLYGYASYSGVTLTASYTAGGGGGGGSCASGYTAYSGSLSGTGSNYYAPTSAGQSVAAGTQNGILTGPTGTDFDLYLQKKSGSSWSSVASGISSSSSENVSYNGAAATYRWRVYSYSGSGSFTLCAKKP